MQVVSAFCSSCDWEELARHECSGGVDDSCSACLAGLYNDTFYLQGCAATFAAVP